ncbi:nucleotide-diphospho-sugar transferase [Spinellus fusiger]|nr:nucleotide-diphospho-sugar transferase [Spinellus fusiger]
MYKHSSNSYQSLKQWVWKQQYPPTRVDKVLVWEDVLQQSPDVRVKAALVTLVHEAELYTLRSTIMDIEARWNARHGYPWVILSDQPLTLRFRTWIRAATKAPIYFGQVSPAEWNEPEWIDQKKSERAALGMDINKVQNEERLHWRKMTRYTAGFLAQHPLLKDLEYYWRVQADARYQCDILQDPFEMMKRENKKLAFAAFSRESSTTTPQLWQAVQSFMNENRRDVYPLDQTIYPWVMELDREKKAQALQQPINSASHCMAVNNFMIASLDFLRSKAYKDFFHSLDMTGGFFYEGWSDSYIHTIAAALFLKHQQVHYVQNLGYHYSDTENCPVDSSVYGRLKCTCNPQPSLVSTDYSCTSQWLQLHHRSS